MRIPNGYQLHVTSWENDGDFYETTIRSGIKSEEDVRFLLALVQAFTSVNERTPGLGNEYIDDDSLINLITSLLQEHPGITASLRSSFTAWQEGSPLLDGEIADRYYEIVCGLLGEPKEADYCDEGRFCRVFDSSEVYYLPDDIEDVTNQFR